MNKEDYYKPIFAKIRIPPIEIPEGKRDRLELEEEEIPDEDFYRLSTDFLMAKILELYLIMDAPNFVKNAQHLAEEMELYIGNHKNEKPNTADVQ